MHSQCATALLNFVTWLSNPLSSRFGRFWDRVLLGDALWILLDDAVAVDRDD